MGDGEGQEGLVGSQGSSGHVRSLHEAGCLPRQTKVLPRGPVRPQRGGAGWRGGTLASPKGGTQLPPRSTPPRRPDGHPQPEKKHEGPPGGPMRK